MVPVGLVHKRGKGWQVLHECRSCGQRRANRVAANTVAPDDIRVLMGLCSGRSMPVGRRARGSA